MLHSIKLMAECSFLNFNIREIFSVVDRSYIVYEGRVILSGQARDADSRRRSKEILFW